MLQDPVRRRVLVASTLTLLAAACLQPVTELERTHDFVVGPEGGKFSLDSGVVLVFPVNAVTEPLSVNVTRITTPSYVRGVPIGPTFRFEPEGAQFTQFVQVTLPITEAIPPLGRLRVARAPDKSRNFELLFPTWAIEGLRTTTSHFSLFVPVALVDDDDAGEPSDLDAGHADAG